MRVARFRTVARCGFNASTSRQDRSLLLRIQNVAWTSRFTGRSTDLSREGRQDASAHR